MQRTGRLLLPASPHPSPLLCPSRRAGAPRAKVKLQMRATGRPSRAPGESSASCQNNQLPAMDFLSQVPAPRVSDLPTPATQDAGGKMFWRGI